MRTNQFVYLLQIPSTDRTLYNSLLIAFSILFPYSCAYSSSIFYRNTTARVSFIEYFIIQEVLAYQYSLNVRFVISLLESLSVILHILQEDLKALSSTVIL